MINTEIFIGEYFKLSIGNDTNTISVHQYRSGMTDNNNPFEELVLGLRERGTSDSKIQQYIDELTELEELDIGSTNSSKKETKEIETKWRSATVKFIDGHHLADPQDKEQSFPYVRLSSDGWLKWKYNDSEIHSAPASQIEFVCWTE